MRRLENIFLAGWRRVPRAAFRGLARVGGRVREVEEVEEVSAVEAGRCGRIVPLNPKHRADLLARALVKRFHRPRPLHSKPPILITRPIIWESGIGASDLNAANFSITWERGGQSDER